MSSSIYNKKNPCCDSGVWWPEQPVKLTLGDSFLVKRNKCDEECSYLGHQQKKAQQVFVDVPEQRHDDEKIGEVKPRDHEAVPGTKDAVLLDLIGSGCCHDV